MKVLQHPDWPSKSATVSLYSWCTYHFLQVDFTFSLSICSRLDPPLENQNDVMNLAQTLAGNFMEIVQYNKDNTAFEVQLSTSPNI